MRILRSYIFQKLGLISRAVNRDIELIIWDSISTAHLLYITRVQNHCQPGEMVSTMWAHGGLWLFTRLCLW